MPRGPRPILKARKWGPRGAPGPIGCNDVKLHSQRALEAGPGGLSRARRPTSANVHRSLIRSLQNRPQVPLILIARVRRLADPAADMIRGSQV
jgi:hypothetical protein